ncbi:MAG: HAD hydrolase-like protein [Nitrospira sp.]|nr:HAD hydrolase-like protein [Nitrospira sp.]
MVVEEISVPDDYRKWDILNNLEVVIPVTFHVRGAVYLENATFIPEDSTEEVRFHVKVVGLLAHHLSGHSASRGVETTGEFRARSRSERTKYYPSHRTGISHRLFAKGQIIMAQTPVDLLIFDLDGTLIESKWDIAHSVNFTLVGLGLPERPIEEIFGFVGDGVKRLLRLAVGEGNQARFEEALRVFRGHYLEHCLDRTTFYPGIEPMLQHFAHKTKAIATNKSIEYTRVILKGLGPQHFGYMVGGDNGLDSSRNPACYCTL